MLRRSPKGGTWEVNAVADRALRGTNRTEAAGYQIGMELRFAEAHRGRDDFFSAVRTFDDCRCMRPSAECFKFMFTVRTFTGSVSIFVFQLSSSLQYRKSKAQGGTHDISADELLSGLESKKESKTREAKNLICSLLAGGTEVLSEVIDREALKQNISPRTVRDAKKELGASLKSKIIEGRKKVFWME